MLSTGASHHLSWGSKEQPVELQSSRRAKRRKVSILSRRPGQWYLVSTLLVLVLIQCVLGSYNPTSAAVSEDATEEHPAEERNNNYRDKWSSAATEDDEKRVQVREFAKRFAGNPDSSSSVIDEDVVVGQEKDHRASDNNPRKLPRITRRRLEGLIRNMTDGK